MPQHIMFAFDTVGACLAFNDRALDCALDSEK